MGLANNMSGMVFQSTLPVWGATRGIPQVERLLMISIHAPRVGSDRQRYGVLRAAYEFNPRSPCGERRLNFVGIAAGNYFNPRSPCGERRAWI